MSLTAFRGYLNNPLFRVLFRRRASRAVACCAAITHLRKELERAYRRYCRFLGLPTPSHVAALVLMGCLLVPIQVVADTKMINAGGSSFIYPLMTKWASEYQKKTGLLLNYQSIGSGAGVQQMLGGTFDFGCTDAPMNAEQLSKGSHDQGAILHLPLVMGAVVPVYKIEGVPQTLRLSGTVIADIFLGRIKNWNDPAIAALNPELKLPDLPISVVRRSDGSGSTYVFTEYLSKVSPDWRSTVGMGTVVDWPRGIGQRGNEGVAGQVARSNGSIGYVELIYALQSKLTFAAVQNQAGEFVQPSLTSVSAAADASLKQVPEDLRYSLTNAPGKDSYPIAGTTWAVVYTGVARDRDGLLADFFRWAVQDGQSIAASLNYAPLPRGIVERVLKKLDDVAPPKKSKA